MGDRYGRVLENVVCVPDGGMDYQLTIEELQEMLASKQQVVEQMKRYHLFFAPEQREVRTAPTIISALAHAPHQHDKGSTNETTSL